jgi:hypothetical protein
VQGVTGKNVSGATQYLLTLAPWAIQQQKGLFKFVGANENKPNIAPIHIFTYHKLRMSFVKMSMEQVFTYPGSLGNAAINRIVTLPKEPRKVNTLFAS